MDRIERYKPEDLKNIPSKKVFTNFAQGDADNVELHIYGGDTLLASNYNVESFRIDRYIKKGRKRKKPRVELDIHDDIRDLGFLSGVYKVQYNFLRDILGSEDENNGLHISEISPSRTEVRIKTTSNDSEFLQKFEELQEKNVEDFVDEGWQDLLANFGENNLSIITNWMSDEDDGILIKLYEPLPTNFQVKDQLWITKEVVTSHTETIKLIPAQKPKQGSDIAGPNFTIEVGNSGGESGWETWNSILGTNSTTKQRLLNKYISGSAYQSTELNIDYHYYNNFIHFSSAKERLENFKFKLGLIEYYDGQLLTLNNMASSSYYNTKNISDYTLKKEEVIQGFDGYENYLYFESSSYQADTNGNGIRLERTWPKTNSTQPYTNALIGSATATAWFTSQSTVALDYDVKNPHNLENVIPFHIRESEDNANYLLFVNMISHHFDTVYNYVEQTAQIHKRDNPLYEGLSKDLVYNVLSSFGWESYQGFHFNDLWEYAFGQNEDGSYANSTQPIGNASTGSIKYNLASPQQSGSLTTREDVSRETWKRMLNNLPYLLKTKGGERGIRALTTTYGLPPTLLRVFEYGGPQRDKATDTHAIYDKFNFSLQFGETSAGTKVQLPWARITNADYFDQTHIGSSTKRSPDMFEFRFNTTTRKDMTLASRGNSMALEIEAHPSASNTTSGKYNWGRLRLIVVGGSTKNIVTDYLPIFDNDWWNVAVMQTTASSNLFSANAGLQLAIAKSPDFAGSRITHTSSVFTGPFIQSSGWHHNAHKIILGGDTSTAGTVNDHYTGSIQEFRSWVFKTNDQTAYDSWNSLKQFHNHTKAPLSIEAYGATGSYAQLVQRYPLGADLNRFSGSWSTDTQIPDVSPSNAQPEFWEGAFTSRIATASNFQGDIEKDFLTEEERHFTPMPDLIRTREVSDKIRIEDNTLSGRLDNRRKSERSSLDFAPLDSNRLGVYYAPHFEIDLDIAHELGGAKFDNYVGNPLDYRDDEYKRLRVLRAHYWKKHTNPYDFFEYIKILKYLDHTLFKQIEQIVPARANAQVGLLVKGNLLERPKVENLQEYVEENHHNGTLDISNYKIKAATTTLGGVYHKWLNPKNGKWEFGDAVQAHTGFQSGSEKSSGELEVLIDTRDRYGHKIDIQGSRYYWDNMHWYSQSVAGRNFNPTASVIQGGASYENGGDFLLNVLDSVAEDFYGLDIIGHAHSTQASLTNDNFKQKGRAFDHPNYGHSQRSTQIARFNDRGNIKYYHHARPSRKYLKPDYHYFAPLNNMGNSGSTGGNAAPAVSMSGYSPAELANGYYRSGLRPVSKSYKTADVQDYRTNAQNRLYSAGCKLVGSDFNMPVLGTVDGGPVVEITDTNPNSLVVGSPSAAAGALEAAYSQDTIR